MPPSYNKPVAEGAKLLPYAILFLSMLFFASNHIVGRLAAAGDVPPIGLSFWRWVIASAIILPYSWKDFRTYYPLLKSSWPVLLTMCISLILFGNALIYIGLNYTTAINSGLISIAQPAVTIFLSWIIFHELITRRQALGSVIAALGVIIIILRGDLTALAGLELNTGDLWITLSVFGFSAYSVLFRLVPKEIPPLVLLNLVQISGIVLLAPFYLWESIYVKTMAFNTITVSAVLWTAIIVAIGAMALWNAGIKAIGANKASVFIYVRMLQLTLLAILLLGEVLYPYHITAFILIILGVYLVSKTNLNSKAS